MQAPAVLAIAVLFVVACGNVVPTSADSTASVPATATPTPVPRPSTGEVEAARSAVATYTEALVRGEYRAAWNMLGPEDRDVFGSLASFSEDKRAYFSGVAGQYHVTPNPTDVQGIGGWLDSTYGATIDVGHAVLVKVDYPTLTRYNAWNAYIVSLTLTGPVIYEVR